MVFEENNPGFAEFKNEGDEVVGVLIKVQDEVGVNQSKLYTLSIAEGKLVNVWGSTILDQRMVGVEPGEKIKIVYGGLGEKQGGKNPPKIFKVFIDRPETDQSPTGENNQPPIVDERIV